MRSRVEKILLFSNFGEAEARNGQVQKARALQDLLSGLGVEHERVDVRIHPVQLLKLFRCFDPSRLVCISLGENGIKAFALIYLLVRAVLFWRRPPQLGYFVVGGWLPRIAAHSRLMRVFLRQVDVTFVETAGLAHECRTFVKEAHVFPNFRSRVDGQPKNLQGDTLKLCFCSRIRQDKGPLVAMDLAERLFDMGISVQLDFHGPIDNDCASDFRTRLRDGLIHYRGSYETEAQAVDIMGHYDFLILPTRYAGECMPGAVVEAFCAATPALVSDWKYLSEIVTHGYNGYVLELDHFVEQATAVLARIHASKAYESLSRASLLTAHNHYSKAAALRILYELWPQFG